MRQKNSGFVLMVSLLLLAGLATMSAVGLMRSTTELVATHRHVASHQAFYLAEAGLDAALWEFEHSGGDFNTGDLAGGGEGWTDLVDATTNPPCAAANTCRRKTFFFPDGGAQALVTVFNYRADTPVIDALGSTPSATSQLRLTLLRNQKLEIPATTTVVGENTAGLSARFSDGTLPNDTIVDGCDAVNPSSCLHGLAVTTDMARDDFVARVASTEASYGYFGERLLGALSQDTNPAWTFASDTPPVHYHYSSIRVPDPAAQGLTYDQMKSLANFAKQEAQNNGCYFNYTNDDRTADNSDPTDVNAPYVRLENRTFGTSADPKVCYVEAPHLKHADGTYVYEDDDAATAGSKEEVYMKGTIMGAGLLVLNGELEASPTGSFTYEGIIVSVGPSAEMDFHGTTDIKGALFVSTTDPTYVTMGYLPTETWIMPEFGPRQTGTIQYDSAAAGMAQDLLAGWDPPVGNPSSSRYTIQMWESR